MTDYFEEAFWKLQNNWHESVKHYEERIEMLEAALRGVISIADRDCPEFRFARKALEGKDDQ